MDFIKSLLGDFDVSSLLPKLDTMLSKVELLARIVVMAGPVILLVLGLWYLLLPPKEANYAVGYRFFWGMSSVESWRFTQLVAGIAWSILGSILSLVMYLLSGGFRGKPLMDIVWKSVEYVFWEMGLLAVSCLIIDLIVVFTFNSKGIRRRPKKNPGKTDAEIVEEEVKRFVHDVNEKLHQKPSLDKVKAAGAALLHKKETAPLPPVQEAQTMPALEQPKAEINTAEEQAAEAATVVQEAAVAEEAPALVEAAVAEAPTVAEAPAVIPVAVPVVAEPSAEEAVEDAEAVQDEKPSLLDKLKAFFTSLAGKITAVSASLVEKVKALLSRMKAKPAAAEESPEPVEETLPEEAAEEAVEEAAEEAEAPTEEAVEDAAEEAEEETEEAPAEETAEAPAEESPALPPVLPPSQQRTNPYGTKKRYPKGNKKKAKK